jgi:diguanylate cyclase (GGDEF)-like protein
LFNAGALRNAFTSGSQTGERSVTAEQVPWTPACPLFFRNILLRVRSSAPGNPMTSEQHPSPDFYGELEALSARDWQLWSICALIIVVFAIGFVAFALPNLVSFSLSLHTNHEYLPQLFLGLITLIILFNVYILEQKRTLDRTRAQMLSQLVHSSQAKQVALVDPLTGVFNRRYMEEVIPREVSKAQRAGTEVSFLMIDVDGFRDINSKFGHFGGDQYLRDVATLLKKTFRGSDTVLRVGGDEFLIILPETSEKQAHRAAERLQWETKWWNQAGHAKYQISLSCGVATRRSSMDAKQVLELADQDMYRAKAEKKLAPSNAGEERPPHFDEIEAPDATH